MSTYKNRDSKPTIEAESGKSLLLSLPVELQTEIIVFAQNPLIMTASRHFWMLGHSTHLRVEYLLHRYGSNALGERSMRRKIATPKVIESLVRFRPCDPKGDRNYLIFKQACADQNYQLARYVIEASLRHSIDKKKTLSRLCVITAMKGSIHMIDVLIHEFHADIHQPNGEQIAFIMACQENKLDMIKHLHQTYGCDLHYRNEWCLRNACLDGYEQLVSFLLASGADVMALNNSALLNAVYKGRSSIVKLLLESGADAQVRNNYCIRFAAFKGDLETIKHLITLGGVNPRSQQDFVLTEACRNGHKDVVKYLLGIISPPNDVNLRDGILLEYALKYGRYSLIEMFLTEYDVDLNSHGLIRGAQFVLKFNIGNCETLRLLSRYKFKY